MFCTFLAVRVRPCVEQERQRCAGGRLWGSEDRTTAVWNHLLSTVTCILAYRFSVHTGGLLVAYGYSAPEASPTIVLYDSILFHIFQRMMM